MVEVDDAWLGPSFGPVFSDEVCDDVEVGLVGWFLGLSGVLFDFVVGVYAVGVGFTGGFVFVLGYVDAGGGVWRAVLGLFVFGGFAGGVFVIGEFVGAVGFGGAVGVIGGVVDFGVCVVDCG